jgi:hypothetical protein
MISITITQNPSLPRLSNMWLFTFFEKFKTPDVGRIIK